MLFLVVELCALTFRKNDISKSNIVATALFGDGAAGAILSTDGEGPGNRRGGRIYLAEFARHHGLGHRRGRPQGARFAQIHSRTLVASDFRPLLDEFPGPARHSIFRNRPAFACHPGGAKVLDALEDAMEMQRGDLKESRSVLRDFGNMSAVTVLFVAERMRLRKKAQQHLADRAGPGLHRRLPDAGWPG